MLPLDLIKCARDGQNNAQAKYSKFYVGCALLSDDDNLKNKIRKLVKMENFFPACDFCDGRPHDPTKALEYAGKGLIKAGKQIPMSSRLPFISYK